MLVIVENRNSVVRGFDLSPRSTVKSELIVPSMKFDHPIVVYILLRSYWIVI